VVEWQQEGAVLIKFCAKSCYFANIFGGGGAPGARRRAGGGGGLIRPVNKNGTRDHVRRLRLKKLFYRCLLMS
jgi:hypothetical protein